MRIELEVISGPQAGQKIQLSANQSSKVGRTELADLCFPHDAQISGLHFAVDCGDDKCTIRDLASTNGTFVNEMQVQEAVVADGDEIVAGETRFRVRLEYVKDNKKTTEQEEMAELAAVGQRSQHRIFRRTGVHQDVRSGRRIGRASRLAPGRWQRTGRVRAGVS